MRLAVLTFLALFTFAWAEVEAPQEGDAPAEVDVPEESAAPDKPGEAEDPVETAAATTGPLEKPRPDGGAKVYVVPINGMIGSPNLFILRRALKDAIENEVDMVLLDMDTPGGRVDTCIEMMEIINKFDGISATFVNPDAISAGSFIAAATNEIYFSPIGKMGASAVIQGTGQDVPETARLKVESYLRANIRVMTQDYPFRSDAIRAMLDAEFEFKIGEDVIKPAGELLTLTAKEAIREYGDPAQPLLASGIYESVEDLLDARFGEGGYEKEKFEITYSEEIAKWMSTFAPALLGLGLLMLFVEFKTPGFGIFGILGLVLLAIFFISNYIAGLAGNEPIVIFLIGVVLVLLELLLFPGTIIFAFSGLVLMLTAVLWSMIDIWPGQAFELAPTDLIDPMVNLVFGLGIAFFGAVLVSKLLPGTWFERQLVLSAAAGGDGEKIREEREASRPQAGAEGVAVTDLFPSGHVEIEGKRYDARSAIHQIEHGAKIRVVESSDFDLVVEEVKA